VQSPMKAMWMVILLLMSTIHTSFAYTLVERSSFSVKVMDFYAPTGINNITTIYKLQIDNSFLSIPKGESFEILIIDSNSDYCHVQYSYNNTSLTIRQPYDRESFVFLNESQLFNKYTSIDQVNNTENNNILENSTLLQSQVNTEFEFGVTSTYNDTKYDILSNTTNSFYQYTETRYSKLSGFLTTKIIETIAHAEWITNEIFYSTDDHSYLHLSAPITPPSSAQNYTRYKIPVTQLPVFFALIGLIVLSKRTNS